MDLERENWGLFGDTKVAQQPEVWPKPPHHEVSRS